METNELCNRNVIQFFELLPNYMPNIVNREERALSPPVASRGGILAISEKRNFLRLTREDDI